MALLTSNSEQMLTEKAQKELQRVFERAIRDWSFLKNGYFARFLVKEVKIDGNGKFTISGVTDIIG